MEERIQQTKNTTTLVVNFWATWCSPCIKELPHFSTLHDKYTNSDIEVLLVSLDMKSRMDEAFIPFLKKHKIKPEIILLSDQDADNWIPRVHEDWGGAIPVTVLVRGDQRDIFQGEFEDFSDLENFVANFLKKMGKPMPPIKGS
ncbi:MAG: TlpA family protein disulfide reductase [Lewinellaceae bacterium]|nr:TlpA family protein disulfide reductase [Lewinellaceae bacterium]